MAIDFTESYPLIQWNLNNKTLFKHYFGSVDDSANGYKLQILQDTDVLIPTTEEVYFYFEKKDNTHGYIKADVIDDYFVIHLTNQVFAAKGKVSCNFQITSNSKWKTSPEFKIEVDENNIRDSIESSDDFIAFQDALNSMVEVVNDAGTAITNINTAINTANQSIANVNTTNTNVQNAENTRLTNETNRANSEATRVSNENTRKTNETNRVNAESSRVTAESGRVSAESTRVNSETNRGTNETTRQNNESTRQTQETTRQNYYNAYKVCEPYNNTKSYVVGNKVTYQGSTYQCKLNGTGFLPTNTTNWILIAQKGSDGAGGDMFKLYYDPNNKETDVFNSINSVYSNTTSGLTATNVKDAIDELSSDKIGISNIDTIITTSITQPTNQEINSYWFVEVVR